MMLSHEERNLRLANLELSKKELNESRAITEVRLQIAKEKNETGFIRYYTEKLESIRRCMASLDAQIVKLGFSV